MDPLDDVDGDSDAHDLHGCGTCQNGHPSDFVLMEPVLELGTTPLILHGRPHPTVPSQAEDPTVAAPVVSLWL